MVIFVHYGFEYLVHQLSFSSFFFNDTATTEIYTLSLHDALPVWPPPWDNARETPFALAAPPGAARSEEHTSELQSRRELVCRLLLEKKNHAGPRVYRHTRFDLRTLAPKLPRAPRGRALLASQCRPDIRCHRHVFF